jgi:hypothetical protein
MNAILFLLFLVAVFGVLPAIIGSLIGYGMSRKHPRIEPRGHKPRKRNIKKRPDPAAMVRLGQTVIF